MLDSIFNKQKSADLIKFKDKDFDTTNFSLPDSIKGKPKTKRLMPEIPEVEVVRHFTNLSRENYGVDNGAYPLGSCTMKYNPKRNDRFANLEGLRDVHPKQIAESKQGIWDILWDLQNMLCELTGMDAFSLQPAAGANGELAGLLMIRKYFESKGQKDRKIILIADSAHGTNPASASMAGFECRIIATEKSGLMSIDALKKEINQNVAALMLTNPSTLGLFEERIGEIAGLLHENGSLLYYDGANMNALMGIVRPGDMGFDVIHINPHKTLSTPHGGGGPGAGPVGVKEKLRPFLPMPNIIKSKDGIAPAENQTESIGRMKSNFGHIDVLIRAYSYMLTLGAEGLKQATEHAVLNANYLQKRLSNIAPPVFNKLCMHECLLNGANLQIPVYTFVKRLIDFGVHPPTLVGAGCVYFSDDYKNSMLIEPTETETLSRLDNIVEVYEKVLKEVKENREFVDKAPYTKSVSQISINAREVN